VSTDHATVYVCTCCRQGEDADLRPGAQFLALLRERLAREGLGEFSVHSVECLSVCKRPATAAFAAAGKWTYVLGDLDAAEHLDDFIVALKAYAASETGVVPWKNRPACFKKGVVSRTPPAGFGADKG